ncbi:hypothetical protein [Psychroserpens sp. MEBiC05023]
MKIKLFALAFITLTILSCSSDDNSSDGGGEASFTVIRDGVTYQGENINNTLIITSQNNQGVRRMDLRCDFDGGTFVLSISNWEFQNPPEDGVVEKSYNTNTEMGPDTDCETIDGITFCDEALVTYILGQEYFVSELNEEGTDIGHITISNNNSGNLTVSGTFDVLMRNFNDPNGENIEYTGSFNNLSYTVFQ